MAIETQAAPAVTASNPSSDRWPKQIKFIVGNEACERFSYYGMTGILAGYISGELAKGGLGQSSDKATTIIHLFKFVNYFMPLFGAWLSDRIIGRYHTILWVSLFYCAGHGVLACSDLAGEPQGKLNFLFVGLGLIAFGSGGIKPCVSAFVGDQFRSDQSHLLQKAYGAFYWSINFGSFFSFLVIPWIKDAKGYSWAFAVPGILMGIATFVFWLGTKYYKHVPPSRETRSAGFISVFRAAYKNHTGGAILPFLNFLSALGLPLIAMAALIVPSLASEMTPMVSLVGKAGLACVAVWFVSIVALSIAGRLELPTSFWSAARGQFKDEEISAARSVGPILFVFAMIPIFWSLFDQTNSTWVLQGEKMVPFMVPVPFMEGGLKIGAEQMQSANAALVMILVPILTLGVYPRLGKLATPLRRMSVGLFLTAASYVIVAMIQQRVEAGIQLSVAWQTVPYIVLTTAEVLVSTTGLEFAFTQAAPTMKSSIMSFWLLTVAFGNLVVSAVTKLLSKPGAGHGEGAVTTGRFLVYAGMTFVVAILFSVIAARYRYRGEPEAA
jgi:POT family proton-dependent oligopeptide transporter